MRALARRQKRRHLVARGAQRTGEREHAAQRVAVGVDVAADGHGVRPLEQLYCWSVIELCHLCSSSSTVAMRSAASTERSIL